MCVVWGVRVGNRSAGRPTVRVVHVQCKRDVEEDVEEPQGAGRVHIKNALYYTCVCQPSRQPQAKSTSSATVW